MKKARPGRGRRRKAENPARRRAMIKSPERIFLTESAFVMPGLDPGI
jgi:hypothetical protein